MIRLICCIFLSLTLAACSSSKAPSKKKSRPTASTSRASSSAKKIRITHISAQKGGSEVVMYAMGLIGIGYQFGGSNPQAGFDCSGMTGYIYKNALGVTLPRTAADIANASRVINKSQLKVGDLVFFNTNGKPYSHMGIYIGSSKFIHAPSTNGLIRTESMNNRYFAQRFTSAHTLF